MNQPKLSERLDMKVRLASPRLNAASERLWTHPDIVTLFPSFLFRLHCEARASINIMRVAVEQLRARADSDPLAPGIIDYLEMLIIEERGHDEWLLDGLEAVGVERDDVWSQIPPATIAALVGAQYYWIYHHHPVCLLGYIKVVEMDPATVEQIESVIARTGLPRDGFRYHFGHAVLELKHNDDLDRVLDSLPLTPEHEALIGMSAARTVHMLALGLEEIVDLHEERGGTSETSMATVPAAGGEPQAAVLL